MMQPRSSPESSRVAATANEIVYDAMPDGAYTKGAPHLRHDPLRRLYARVVEEIYVRAARDGRVPRVLDLGAGEGSATLPFLALGAHVTAVDISARQLEGLRHRCAAYENRLEIQVGDVVHAVREAKRARARYDIIVANSFLHHVPDYLALLRDVVDVLAPCGTIFSFQDPIAYATIGGFTRMFDRVGYLWWRLWQGDVIGGAGRRIRRSFGVYREDCAEDNMEYHVVRGGVDAIAIERMLSELACRVRVLRYFSAQPSLWNRIGTALGLENTFAIIANRE